MSLRLNRLSLTRYGRFTDTELEFPQAGATDLHVIHGPNEAGKSTLLNAWLDFLFRIPNSSAMNFLHDYKVMQISAELTANRNTLSLTRVKKRDASLLDASGAPMPEATVNAALSGLTRASYAAMFSLNRKTLEEGGESILASKGDLGELLFQASAGISQMSERLQALEAQTQDFLARSGRKGTLRDLVKAYGALGEEQKALDTQASQFARLVEARDGAQAHWQDARTAANAARERLLELQNLTTGLRAATRLAQVDRDLNGFADLPEVPRAWITEARALDQAHSRLAAERDLAQRTVDELREELSALPDPDPILALAEQIAQAETLKAAHVTALTDLPRRQADRDAEQALVDASLARLGRVGCDPATVLPEAAVQSRLRAALDAHGALFQATQTARSETARAQSRADRTRAELQSAGGSGADPRELHGLLTTLRKEDPEGALRRAEQALDQADATLFTALSALAPWSGTAAQLADLSRPDPAILPRISARLTQAEQAQAQAVQRVSQLEEDVQHRTAALRESATGPGASPEEAAEARRHREAAWALHRARLDGDSADAFERAMRLDDQHGTRLAQSRARAEVSQAAERALELAETRLSGAQAELCEARDALEQAQAALDALRLSISPALPAGLDAAGLAGWLDRLATADAALGAQRSAARLADRLQGAAEQSRRDLLATLGRAGRDLPPDTGLVAAIEVAQALLDDAARLRGLDSAHRDAIAALAERKRMEDAAVQALARWQDGWTRALDGTAWAGAQPDPAEMRGILDELTDLRRHHEKLTELDHRIATMTDNRDRFQAALRALALAARMDPSQPPATLWQDCTMRLATAEKIEDRRSSLTARLSRAKEAQTQVAARANSHDARVAEITAHFGLSDWPAARHALDRAAERGDLDARRKELADDLCQALSTPSPEAALDRLEGLNADKLEIEAEALHRDLTPLQSQQEAAHATLQQAQSALDQVGGDGSVARLESRRQTLLEQIADGAQQHLRRRLGLAALEDALRRYRDAHRSTMMTRASDAFSAITGGRYSGLSTVPDRQQEVLVALLADGRSAQADQLSEGTRAQLYLALRIAGYHEFVAQNGPVPFIADDIMESFDDARAAETFRLLGEMSRQGQVIYLTHHAHMRDLARDACPQVTLHELPG